MSERNDDMEDLNGGNLHDRPPVGPRPTRRMPRYAAPDTLARLQRLDQVQRAAVALLGVPFDSGVSYRQGARFGPAGVRAGSKLLRPYHPDLDVSPWGVHTAEDLPDDRGLGYATVSTVEIGREGTDAALERIRSRVVDLPLYISVDIDVLDPAHAPGTGTPKPGGLTTRELQELLRGLTGMSIVGADVVEVAPAYDHAELTALAAAHVAYELLALLALPQGARAAVDGAVTAEGDRA